MANWIDSATPLPEIAASTWLAEVNSKGVGQSDSSNGLGQLCSAAQPLVIRGLVSDWPAVQAANGDNLLNYLAQYSTAEPVTLYRLPPGANGRIFYNQDFSGFNFQAAKKPLAEVFRLLREEQRQATHTSYYMGSTPVERFLPNFARDNNITRVAAVAEYFAELAAEPLVSIWLGTATHIAAHYDFPQNIACCIAGKRRFVLLPPQAVSGLYVGPLEMTPSGQPISLVDFNRPDLRRFPRFADVMTQARVAELAPGDGIYIPSMWWHQVESYGAINGLVNYWWRDTPAYMGTPTDVLHHALLSLKSLPVAQRNAWQALLEYFVFDQSETPPAGLPKPVVNGATWQQTGLSADLARQLQRQLKQRINRLN